MFDNKRRNFFIDLINSVPDRVSLGILILANFICNNIFIFNLKYYADDFPNILYPNPYYPPIARSLLNSQRPINFAVFGFQQQIANDPLVFHLIAFISTTITLILIYFIFKRIFQDFGYENMLYPFLGAIFFCVLFNKDQAYAWPIMSTGLGFLMPILAIYLYLNKEKKYFLILSAVAYFLSLLTYEVGICVPAFLFLYDYLRGNDWKKSLYFAIPLTLYLTIRYTKWFGYGWVSNDRGFGTYGLETVINAFTYPIITGDVLLRSIISSASGFMQMSFLLIGVLIIINIGLLLIIIRHLNSTTTSKSPNIKLFFIAILMILVFWAPYIIKGYQYLPPRAFYLCDIGIALFMVCIILLLKDYRNIKLLAICIIFVGLFINQGLYYNWVISGDSEEKIDNYIRGNSDELIKYDYIYFNTRSFTDSLPVKGNWQTASIYWAYIAVKKQLSPPPRPTNITSSPQYDRGYISYYNAVAVTGASLNAMIWKHTNYQKMNYTLIYGEPGWSYIPLNVIETEIIYREKNGNVSAVSRNKVFEINRTAVVSFNQQYSTM